MIDEERKLATIQKINNITLIENADKIELAHVLGWECVVKKDEFSIGDTVIFIEVDSVLPDKPEFEFLSNSNFRVKTIRLRGQFSQGLILSLNYLKTEYPNMSFVLGDDVTELLEIKKYEPKTPYHLRGNAKGNFPYFIPKTKEIRIQNKPSILEKYKDKTFFVTEKLDGTSVTYYVKDGVFGVCSRNLELKEKENNLYWEVARKHRVEERLRAFGFNIAVQGEIIGKGIQGNKYGLEDNQLHIFNYWDIDKQEYIVFNNKQLLPTVPFVDIYIYKPAHTKENTVSNLVYLTTGYSEINPKVKREGLIFRHYFTEDGKQKRISFKVINPEFLVKYGE